VQYVHGVKRRWSLARSYWFDVLVVLLAVAGMLDLVARTGALVRRRTAGPVPDQRLRPRGGRTRLPIVQHGP